MDERVGGDYQGFEGETRTGEMCMLSLAGSSMEKQGEETSIPIKM